MAALTPTSKAPDLELFYPCTKPLVMGALDPHLTKDPAGIVASYVMGKEEPFGAEAWKRYFGVELEKEVSFTAALQSFMYGPDPLEPSKRCYETHLPPVFRPSFITLNILGKLVQKPKEGHPSKYYGVDMGIIQNGDKIAGPDCWLVFRKDIFGREKTFEEGVQFMRELNEYTGTGYEAEPSAIDLATVVFAHHVKTGQFYLGYNGGMEGRITYSRAKETFVRPEDRTITHVGVGGFTGEGLLICDSLGLNSINGLAAVRRFELILRIL